MTSDKPRNMQARLLNELRAQVNIVPEIINA